MLGKADAVMLRPEIITINFPFALPRLICSAGEPAQRRYMEFFAGTIRNTHTRRPYARATVEFLSWCSLHGVMSLGDLQPLHVATWIEQISRGASMPTMKQRLAAVRHLFDWLVTGQVVPVNPAASVRGPSHGVRRGKTPVLDPKEARTLLDAIDLTTLAGLRDRALIGLMVYTFARIGAALAMRVEDVIVQNRRLWVRLHEKGGKRHEMPWHHKLEEYLTAYLDECELRDDLKGPLFRTITCGTKQLSDAPCPRPMPSRWFVGARSRTISKRRSATTRFEQRRSRPISRMAVRWRKLPQWAIMPLRATTQLYDRRRDEVTLDEVERVLI